MPSSVTHAYFGEDVFNKCNKRVKNKIINYINYLKVFSQGPDPYFFYDFHLTNRSMDVYRINRAMQHAKVNKHFIKLINYINDNGYYSNGEVMSYLYGQICHFVLDTTAHPYIIYSTGIYDEKDPKTFKYNGLHEEMEYYIDCYLISRRENIHPKKYKVYKQLFNIDKFSDQLNVCINNVIKEVYGFDSADVIYYKSIMDMKKFYYIFNYDRIGIKKFIYSIMDIVCGNKCVKKKELSFNVNPHSKLFYLNKEKSTWNNPCDINEKYNYSFDELYKIATDKAVNIINTIDDMLSRGIVDNKKIEDLFGNRHYGTGKDCDQKYDYQYFKF